MARPKKNTNRDANSETIRDFFQRSMRLREDQQDISTLISALNAEMSEAGVDPGVMSLCRRIASMDEGKRGLTIALTRFYFDVLEDVLEDSIVDINELIRKAKQREMESVAPAPAGNGGSAQQSKPMVVKGDAKGALAAAQKHLGTEESGESQPAS